MDSANGGSASEAIKEESVFETHRGVMEEENEIESMSARECDGAGGVIVVQDEGVPNDRFKDGCIIVPGGDEEHGTQTEMVHMEKYVLLYPFYGNSFFFKVKGYIA